MRRIGVYGKLQMIPLFTGMSQTELETVVGQTKLLFSKVDRGEDVIEEGDRSGRLVFLVDGSLLVKTLSDDHAYAVEEELSGCRVLQPESAFGLKQRFTHTYHALTACSLVSIAKNDALRLTSVSLIFRLNLMNLISTALQKECGKVWRKPPESLQDRVSRFLADRCQQPSGKKVFKIKLQRMALELNESCRKVSECLHAMQEKGLVTLGRGRIVVPALEKLS